MRFVKAAGLHADLLSVEVGDGLIFCRVSGGQSAGEHQADHKQHQQDGCIVLRYSVVFHMFMLPPI